MTRIVLVGALPPPVHGMAAVNQAIFNQFKKNGVDLRVIDISSATLYRSFLRRLSRLPKVLGGLFRFLLLPGYRGEALYMSVSGGLGQLYELCFLLIARARSMKIYLHYHSFAYLDRHKLITELLIRAGGPQCTHITLSREMSCRLKARYKAATQVVWVSNAVFFAGNGATKLADRPGLRTLGFLSNISADKGIFDFLDLVAACEAEGLPLQARIAGPFQDQETENRVRARLEQIPSAEYVGPKYAEAKTAFLNSIDVLVFPTRYVNEAEPLTLHEAMQHKLPVIAYGRGAVPEIININCGMVIDPEGPFVPVALECLKRWLENPDSYKAASSAALQQFAAIMERNLQQWHTLIGGIFRNTT